MPIKTIVEDGKVWTGNEKEPSLMDLATGLLGVVTATVGTCGALLATDDFGPKTTVVVNGEEHTGPEAKSR